MSSAQASSISSNLRTERGLRVIAWLVMNMIALRTTGKAQFVGEEIAYQPPTFVRGPARRIGAHRKVPEVEAVGIDFSDDRRAVRHLAGRAEALGCEQQPVFAHDELDIASDSLCGDRILGVVGYPTVEKHNLDIDAGRHLDDGLVLLGPLDQVLGGRVCRLSGALAEPAAKNVAGRELGNGSIWGDLLVREDRVRVGGEPAPEPANDPGKQRLGDEISLAADNAAAHARLAGKADEAFDLAHRHAPTGLIAGHPRQFDVDLLRGEIAARRAVGRACKEQAEAYARHREDIALAQQRLRALVGDIGQHGRAPQPASTRQWEGGVATRPVNPGGRYQ